MVPVAPLNRATRGVMKNFVVGVVVLGLGLVAERGQAAQLELAGRLGYQIATGKIADAPPASPSMDAFDLNESVAGQVPIGFEIGVRVIPMLALGGYLDLAPGILTSDVRDACDELDHDCSSFGVHLGLMAHLHVLPEEPIDPWFGLGIGAEGLAFGESVGPNTLVASFGGVEFPLRAGVDFKLGKRVSLGPYVGYTFGPFSTATLSCDGPDCAVSEIESDIEETASHGWFGFGAKLTILAF